MQVSRKIKNIITAWDKHEKGNDRNEQGEQGRPL